MNSHDLAMASLNTSHASLGNSTVKDARDLTISSFGGPEDFTLNIIDHMRCNKPNFKRKNREQLTTSSLGGPEDFTADIVKHANRTKDGNCSQLPKGQVKASPRRASEGSGKTSSRLSSHPQTHSSNHRTNSTLSAVATSKDGESQTRREVSTQSETSSPPGHVKARSSNKLVRETSNDSTLDDNGAASVVFRDGKVHRKHIRGGVGQQMQPTVSDDEGNLEKGTTTQSLVSSPFHQTPPDPTMLLPVAMLEDDLTIPLGESTSTQHSLESTVSSQEQPVQDTSNSTLSLAHRTHDSPASAKKAESEHSINLPAGASELLMDDMRRPETFHHNDSLVSDCIDPRLAFANRKCDTRPDVAVDAQLLAEPKSVDETESLRQQLAQMKSTLAQREGVINDLQGKLLAKEAECTDLYSALQDKSVAIAAAESRELALKDAVRAAQAETAAAGKTAAERFAIVKDALLAAEDEAAGAAERAEHAVLAVQSKADAAASRCRRLEQEVQDLTASAQVARAEAKRAREEQTQRETLWMQRSEILLAECDRRGQALMLNIGEQELPGVRDGKGRQAYRYQSREKCGRVGTAVMR